MKPAEPPTADGEPIVGYLANGVERGIYKIPVKSQNVFAGSNKSYGIAV